MCVDFDVAPFLKRTKSDLKHRLVSCCFASTGLMNQFVQVQTMLLNFSAAYMELNYEDN